MAPQRQQPRSLVARAAVPATDFYIAPVKSLHPLTKRTAAGYTLFNRPALAQRSKAFSRLSRRRDRVARTERYCPHHSPHPWSYQEMRLEPFYHCLFCPNHPPRQPARKAGPAAPGDERTLPAAISRWVGRPVSRCVRRDGRHILAALAPSLVPFLLLPQR